MSDGAGLRKGHIGMDLETKLQTTENSAGHFEIGRFPNGDVRLRITYKDLDEYDNPRMAEVSAPIEGDHPLLQNINWNDGTIKLDVFTPSAVKKEEGKP